MAITTAINTENGEILILDGLESSGGGGGGTSDYTELTNKPKINNITLSGNKTGTQLGVADLSADNTFTGMNTFDDAILADEIDDATGVNVVSVADDGTRKLGSVLKGLKLASDGDIEVRKGSESNIGIVYDSLNLKPLRQFATMPTASSSYTDLVVQYIGATDSTYTSNYIYKCTQTGSATATVTFTPAKISISGDNLLAFMRSVDATQYLNVVSGTMTYYTVADLWAFAGKNAQEETIIAYQQYTSNWEDVGFTFTGTFTDEEVVSFVATITPNYSYAWNRVDVQPSQARTTVTDTSSSTITLANANANTDYVYGTLSALTVTANDTSLLETTIQFTADSTITVTLPNTLTYIGGTPTFSATKKYVLAIFNNMCVVGEVGA